MYISTKKAVSTLLFFSSLSLHATSEVKHNQFLHGCELYSKTLTLDNPEKSASDKKKNFNKAPIEHLTDDQMISLALHQISKLQSSTQNNTTILDRHFLKKTEIFCGEENKKQSLFAVLDNTTTVFGKVALIQQLSTPSYGIDLFTDPLCDNLMLNNDEEFIKTKKNIEKIVHDTVLIKTQDIIRKLVHDAELFQKIQSQLDRIKDLESFFFTYFQESNPTTNEFLKKVYWGNRLNFLNGHEWTLELGVRLSHLGNLFTVSALPLLLGSSATVVKQFKNELTQQPKSSFFKDLGLSLGDIIDPRLKNYKDGIDGKKETIKNNFSKLEEVSKEFSKCAKQFSKNQGNEELQKKFLESSETFKQEYITFFSSLLDIIPQTAGDIGYLINSAHGTPKYLMIGILSGLAGLQAYTTYTAAQDCALKQTIYNYLQTKLIAVASYIQALQELARIVEAHEVFDILQNRFNLISLNYPNLSSLSQDCKKLLKLLQHTTFTGEASFFSLTGFVLKAHTLMEKVKEELIPACFAAGHLDAHLSTAKLYKKHEHLPSKFCFVTFDTVNESPYVIAHNFWNPFLDPVSVIKNTIEIGLNKPHNIVLSGPNTGGKSTLLKALLIDLFLAQTLTIAPAESLTITPYVHLNCYLNITDDLTAGTSLFKAEVLRAKALINAIRNLKNQDFSFTIIDEIFSGTSPQEGEEAAVQFAHELSASKNSLCILATHFPRLTQELPEDLFKNYHVTVFKDHNGMWVRPFTLQEGASSNNIALDLLKEEGIFNT